MNHLNMQTILVPMYWSIEGEPGDIFLQAHVHTTRVDEFKLRLSSDIHFSVNLQLINLNYLI